MDNYKFSAFGMRLKALREARHIKQGELADILRISRQSMSNYESGKHSPDIDVIIRMADYFEWSTDYLFGLTDLPTNEMQKGYSEDMALLSRAISSIPWPIRETWIDTFTSTAQYVQQGLSKRVRADFTTTVFYSLIEKLWDICISVTDMRRAKTYTAKDMQTANNNLRAYLRMLERELRDLDDMCYQCINPPLDGDCEDNTNNTITHKNEG